MAMRPVRLGSKNVFVSEDHKQFTQLSHSVDIMGQLQP
jgi:hypothetical protein